MKKFISANIAFYEKHELQYDQVFKSPTEAKSYNQTCKNSPSIVELALVSYLNLL